MTNPKRSQFVIVTAKSDRCRISSYSINNILVSEADSRYDGHLTSNKGWDSDTNAINRHQ